MSQFTGELTITHIDADWRRWRLHQPLEYEVGFIGSGRVIEVPAGFVTDGASVPRPLWWLLPTWGRYSRAAVVHDYCYAMLGAALPPGITPPAASYREADAICYEAMVVCGVGPLTRYTIWTANRLWSGIILPLSRLFTGPSEPTIQKPADAAPLPGE